jgi:hypothetical protein
MLPISPEALKLVRSKKGTYMTAGKKPLCAAKLEPVGRCCTCSTKNPLEMERERDARYQSLSSLREGYANRIINGTEQLVTNFFGLLESSTFQTEPDDLAGVTRENLQIDLYSSNVVPLLLVSNLV